MTVEEVCVDLRREFESVGHNEKAFRSESLL